MSTIFGAIVFDFSVGDSVSGDEKFINDIGLCWTGDESTDGFTADGVGGGGRAGRLFSIGSESVGESSANNSRATMTELVLTGWFWVDWNPGWLGLPKEFILP